MQPITKHPQCQGGCWCAPGGGNSSLVLSLQNFFPESSAHSVPKPPPLAPQAHPRGWYSTFRRRCSCDLLPACPRGQGWAVPPPSNLFPRTASGCAGGVGKGIGSVSSPTYPKDFKVRLWPDLNPWRTGYWPQGLGEEHWERSPGTCALAPAQSPRAVRPWASHFTSADWLPHWGLLLYPQSHL